jgi:adenylate cyclase
VSRSPFAERSRAPSWRDPAALLLAALALLLAAGTLAPVPGLAPVLHRLDALWHDTLARAREPSPTAAVTVLEVDEAALARHGRWPWSRAVMAAVVDGVFADQRPAALGLDILLAEPEGAGPDGRLARALEGRPVVLAADLHAVDGAVLPALAAAAAGTGFVNAAVDADGVSRELALAEPERTTAARSFALELVRVGARAPAVRLQPRAGGWQLSWPGAAQAPPVQHTGPAMRVRLPVVAPDGLARWSVADLGTAALPPGALDGRLVLIGVTAAGLGDRHLTVSGPDTPGIWLHAALAAQLQGGQAAWRPAWGGLAAAVALLALHGLGSGLWQRGPRPAGLGPAGLLPATAAGVWLLLAAGLQLAGHRLLPVAAVLLLATAWSAALMLRQRHAERQALRRLAPVLARTPAADGPRVPPAAGGPAREVSVLFADLRGFTALGETLPPQRLAGLLDAFYAEMDLLVREHGGTVDKYIGDAVMALWGVAASDPDHARRALAAARSMLQQLPRLNAHLREQGLPPLQLGIGLQCGVVAVGGVGAGAQAPVTVIGDAVNVASRLEALAGHLGIPALVGDALVQRLPPEARAGLRRRGAHRLRGRLATVEVWSIDVAQTAAPVQSAAPQGGA